MHRQLKTEDQVKQALGIQTWRNLSKEKAMQFVSVLPDVDHDVAMKIIEQFPAFSQTAAALVDGVQTLVQSVLTKADENTKKCLEADQQVIDALTELLACPTLSAEDKRYFADKVIEVTDKMAEKDKESKGFFVLIIGTAVVAFFTGLGVYAGVLGAQYKQTQISR